MSDLYDTDIVTWSERQAELLRRRAAGELVSSPCCFSLSFMT